MYWITVGFISVVLLCTMYTDHIQNKGLVLYSDIGWVLY